MQGGDAHRKVGGRLSALAALSAAELALPARKAAKHPKAAMSRQQPPSEPHGPTKGPEVRAFRRRKAELVAGGATHAAARKQALEEWVDRAELAERTEPSA